MKMTNGRGGREKSKGPGGDLRMALYIFMKMSLCNPELSVYNQHILKEDKVKKIYISFDSVQ